MEHAAKEEKREQEDRKKHQEQEEARKKGKEKVGETFGRKKAIPPSPVHYQGIMLSPVREPEGEVHLTSWKRLQQWRAQQKATITYILTPDAKLEYKKQRQEDVKIIHQQVTRNLKLLDLVHRALPEEK